MLPLPTDTDTELSRTLGPHGLAWPEINSATQSQRVNQQFEIQRWPLTEGPCRALHKFSRIIGDLTGCKTSWVHYWFVSILTSYCACSCWNYILTFWFLPGFSCIPFKFPSTQQFEQLELTRPGTVYINSYPLGGCLICSSDYLLMPAIQLTIWYSRYQKIALYLCHTICHVSDKFITGLWTLKWLGDYLFIFFFFNVILFPNVVQHKCDIFV